MVQPRYFVRGSIYLVGNVDGGTDAAISMEYRSYYAEQQYKMD